MLLENQTAPPVRRSFVAELVSEPPTTSTWTSRAVLTMAESASSPRSSRESRRTAVVDRSIRPGSAAISTSSTSPMTPRNHRDSGRTPDGSHPVNSTAVTTARAIGQRRSPLI